MAFPRYLPESLALLLLASLFLYFAGSKSTTDYETTATAEWSWRLVKLAIPLSMASVGIFVVFESRGLVGSTWNALPLGILVALLLTSLPSRSTTSEPVDTITSTERGVLLLTMTLLFGLYAIPSTDWRYSYIGDEYGYLQAADSLSQVPILGISWFEASGPADSGFLPVAVSAYQGLWIRLAGDSNLGWRASSAFLIVVSFPFFYLFSRKLVSYSTVQQRTGFSVLAFAVSITTFLTEPLLIWSRIGKPLVPILPWMVIAISVFEFGRSRRSPRLFALAGIFAGAGIYFSPLGPTLAIAGTISWAVLTTPISTLRKSFAEIFYPLALFGASAVLIAAPILVQQDYFAAIASRTVLSGEAARNSGLTLHKTFQSIFAFLGFQGTNHFHWGEVIDPFFAALIAVGVCGLRRNNLRHHLAIIVICSVTSYLTGGLSQYNYPPLTRFFTMMIPFGMLASLGAGYLLAFSIRGALAFCGLILACSALFNTVKVSSYNPYQRSVGFEQHMVKLWQENPDTQFFILMQRDTDAWPLEELAKLYHADLRTHFITLPAGRLTLAAEESAPCWVAPRDSSIDFAAVKAFGNAAKCDIFPTLPDGLPQPSPSDPLGVLIALALSKNRG
jgi:hypothetical protein